MEKEKNSMIEIYNYDFLLSRAVDLLQDYEANPQNQIRTLLECSNLQFLGALEFVGRSLFGGLNLSDDPLLLAFALSVYVSIVNKYGKTASVEGFAFFAVIDPETVRGWQADAKTLKKGQTMTETVERLLYIYDILYFKELSQKTINIQYTKGKSNLYYNFSISEAEAVKGELSTIVNGLVYNRLHDFRESAIKYKMIDSKQQIGALAVANNEFGWSADRIGQEERARALTLQDLPKLTDYVNPQKTIESDETQKTPIL